MLRSVIVIGLRMIGIRVLLCLSVCLFLCVRVLSLSLRVRVLPPLSLSLINYNLCKNKVFELEFSLYIYTSLIVTRDRQTADRPTDRQQTDRQRQKERQTDRQQTDRQRQKERERETDRRAEIARQTELIIYYFKRVVE